MFHLKRLRGKQILKMTAFRNSLDDQCPFVFDLEKMDIFKRYIEEQDRLEAPVNIEVVHDMILPE